MKKLTIATLMLLASFSIVSAEIGLRIGGSVEVGEFSTSGFEKEGAETSETKTEQAFVGLGSYFIEGQLGFLPGPLKRISIGYSTVPHKLSTGTSSREGVDLRAKAAVKVRPSYKNAISAEISNYDTLYATVNITDWLFVKYGTLDMDVKTTENLETGSAYGNFTTSGTVWGVGLHHQTESGFFGRVEWNDTEIDGKTLTSTSNADNIVTLKEMTGDTAKISFGKAF